MTLSLPVSNIQLAPDERATEGRVEQLANDLQLNLDFIAELFPLQQAQLAQAVNTAVTSLPAKAPKGTQLIYAADATNGIYWHLVYVGEGSWAKIGGPPLFKEVPNQEGTASATFTDLGTKGPELTIPALKGDYYCHFGTVLWNNTANCHASYGIAMNGAAVSMEIDTNQNTGGAFGTSASARLVRLNGVPASTVFLAKYRRQTGGEAAFVNRWMSIDPIRVG